MNKIYYAILFVMVMVLAGCDSQPPELKSAIRNSAWALKSEFTITSAQKSNIPNNSMWQQWEEVWCVTVSPPLGLFEDNNFLVRRVGISWSVTPVEESDFLALSCTNYEG